MALTLNLNKSAETLKLCLVKAGILTPPEAEVGFDMDVSGSFEDEHENGNTNAIMNRLVPWGMVFDPDKKLDMFTFSNGVRNAHYVGEVTAANCESYVQKNIIRKVPGYNGGTDYAHVIRKNLEHFGWIESAEQPQEEKSTGFFSGLFGGGKKQAPSNAAVPVQRKSLIMFITDGENNDRTETERLLQEMQNRGDEVYIMFFGISEDRRVKFEFIQKMADKFDNTGIYICRDIKAFVNMSDEEINGLIISDELVTWLKK